MFISKTIGDGAGKFTGTVKALLTLMSIVAAYQIRGYGVCYPATADQTELFTWPGTGAVEVTMNKDMAHFDVTFKAGRVRTHLTYLFSR